MEGQAEDPVLRDIEVAKMLRLSVAVVRQAFGHLAVKPLKRPATWRWRKSQIDGLWSTERAGVQAA